MFPAAAKFCGSKSYQPEQLSANGNPQTFLPALSFYDVRTGQPIIIRGSCHLYNLKFLQRIYTNLMLLGLTSFRCQVVILSTFAGRRLSPKSIVWAFNRKHLGLGIEGMVLVSQLHFLLKPTGKWLIDFSECEIKLYSRSPHRPRRGSVWRLKALVKIQGIKNKLCQMTLLKIFNSILSINWGP